MYIPHSVWQSQMTFGFVVLGVLLVFAWVSMHLPKFHKILEYSKWLNICAIENKDK